MNTMVVGELSPDTTKRTLRVESVMTGAPQATAWTNENIMSKLTIHFMFGPQISNFNGKLNAGNVAQPNMNRY